MEMGKVSKVRCVCGDEQRKELPNGKDDVLDKTHDQMKKMNEISNSEKNLVKTIGWS